MSSESIRYECPPTCPKVKEYLRAKIKKEPWLTDGIFPRKNDAYPLPDVPRIHDAEFREIPEEVTDVVNTKPINYYEKIEEVPSKVIEDIVKVTPIPEEIVIKEKEIIYEEPWLLNKISPKKNDIYLPSPDVTEEIKEIQEEVIDVVSEKIEEIPKVIEDIVEVTPIPEEIVVQENEISREIEEKEIIRKEPWLLEEILPEKNEVYPSPDVLREIPEEVIDVGNKKPIDYNEKIEEIPSKDIVEVTPIPEKAVIEEPKIVIDVVDKKPIDYNEKIEEIPSKDIVEVTPIPEKAVIEEPKIVEELAERIMNHKEKIDLVEEEVPENAIIKEEVAIPMERRANHEEKIDLIKKKELVNEITVAEPVKEIPVEKPEIIEDEIERAAEIEPEELEEYFELEKRVEYDENEEGITDYEKFIAEELREALPAVRKNQIPEKPREVPREISRNAVYEEIDRNTVRPSREPEERRIRKVPAKVNRIILRKPKIAHVCDETCPFIKEQKERFMRKLKERQRVIDHYYLTKGFNYFEDVCTCSLACMVYALSRDPFVRSVFASLALFAVGLKLCSELDAWEMPNRVS